MNCGNCGAVLKEGVSFCPACGTKVSNQAQAYAAPQTNTAQIQQQAQPVQPPHAQPVYSQQYAPAPQKHPVSAEYQPISMWGYFGWEILFSIPIVGIVLLLVFSFGGTPNVNLKNFARSYFCFLIVLVVLFFLLGGFAGIAALSSN